MCLLFRGSVVCGNVVVNSERDCQLTLAYSWLLSLIEFPSHYRLSLSHSDICCTLSCCVSVVWEVYSGTSNRRIGTDHLSVMER